MLSTIQLMSTINELWSTLFDYGFWGFLGTVILIVCFVGSYGLLKSDEDTETKVVGFIIIFIIGCGGTFLREYGKEQSRSSYESEYIEQDYDYNGSSVSFKGADILKSNKYLDCNNCPCERYIHYRGQERCLGCAEYGCSSNKFGHRH